VRPSLPSQEQLRQWIQTEVASRLAPYERSLEEAKTVIAGKDVEIASLKAELEKVNAQKKSSAAPATGLQQPTRLRLQTRSVSRGCRIGGTCSGNSDS
jgi:hypothetical protein